MRNGNHHSRDKQLKQNRSPNPLDIYDSLDERNTEVAGEITPEEINQSRHSQDQRKEMYNDEADLDRHTWLGWLAVVLSVLAFFWMPLILGTAGIVLGIIARNRDLNVLGTTAIIVGLVVVVLRLFILPMV